MINPMKNSIKANFPDGMVPINRTKNIISLFERRIVDVSERLSLSLVGISSMLEQT